MRKQKQKATTVGTNGVVLAVETFGRADDPAVLLIQGAANSMLSWREEFAERIAMAGRYVIRYDNRDTGRSTSFEAGAPPYALRDLVADAVGLLDELGIARAHLVGMSMGGAIAQLLALDHPDRVASLTVTSSQPGGPGHEQPDLPPVTDEMRALFADEGPAPDWSDRAAVIEYLVEAERPFAAKSRPFDEADLRELSGRIVDRANDIAASMTNHFLIDSGEPWRHRLGEIAVPALVLHGTEDPLFPYGNGVAMAKEIPGAQLLPMEHVGHEVPPRIVWNVVIPAIVRHTADR